MDAHGSLWRWLMSPILSIALHLDKEGWLFSNRSILYLLGKTLMMIVALLIATIIGGVSSGPLVR